MKREWTQDSARKHIKNVNRGAMQFGLTYCSACSYLGITVEYAKTLK